MVYFRYLKYFTRQKTLEKNFSLEGLCEPPDEYYNKGVLMNNKKQRNVAQMFITLMIFWGAKLVLAILTMCMFGVLISVPAVGGWSLIFRALNLGTWRNFFCSWFVTGCTVPAHLATDYLRIGMLETPIVVLIYWLYKAAKPTEQKEG